MYKRQGLLIVGLMTIAAYFRAKDDSVDPGTTTVAAILVCYGLGAAVWYDNDTLAIMLAIITTVLLYFKAELHGITEKLSRRDLISILQFAVLTFIILPILPDKNYGPYEAINPYPVSYTHLRAHETVLDLVCRLLLEKKKKNITIDRV